MTPRPLNTLLAILLTITLVVPSAFFIAPQRAHAFWGIGDITFDPIGFTKTTISAIQNTITKTATVTSAAADVAMQVNAYVLQPLAFALSGKLMKSITASVISFAIGEANGTGIPQFVVDTRKMMQSVGDSQALAYIKQFNINSNSPFASAISSSLRTNYLQNTSLAGAWAANMCTLERSSPNIDRFLAGDWSQGGAGAWLALTTQDQNNPYALYITMQGKLGSLVIDAQTARANEVNQGSGFLSWCGGSDTKLGAITTLDTPLRAAQNAVDAANETYNTALEAVINDTTDNPYLQTDLDAAKSAYDKAHAKLDSLTSAVNASSGINPGDPCINEDGSEGTIKTPGSVIAASLNKALGGTQDKLVQMGNVAKEVNGIFKDISTVMQVAQFASNILGGSDSGGLLGVNKTSGSSSNSQLNQYRDSAYLGVTESGVRSGNTAAPAPTSVDDMLDRIAKYQVALDTIRDAADKAGANITKLGSFCTEEMSTASTTLQGMLSGTDNLDKTFATNFINKNSEWAAATEDILANDISPVLAQVEEGEAIIAAANAMVKKIQAESPEAALLYGPTATTDELAYNTDMQTLQTMSPTAEEVRNAQRDARPFNAATAVLQNQDPKTVSGNTLIDQMNSINKKATEKLKDTDKYSCDFSEVYKLYNNNSNQPMFIATY